MVNQLISLSRNKKIFLLIAPFLFQTLFKKRGGFLYRQMVSFIIIGFGTMYGVIASVLFTCAGNRGNINYSVARFTSLLVRHFLGITATVEGKENLPKPDELAIYVCNHQTVMDIIFISFIIPKRTSMVAKKIIKYYPFLGWFMTLSKSIFLDRGNRENAVKQAKQAAIDIHAKKQSVFIFPEGTRSNSYTNTLLPFKKGAFYMATQAQVPIIPIVICNYKDIYNANTKHYTYGDLKMKILPPVSTLNIPETSEAINELTNRVRDQMLTTLKEISTPDKLL